jgi:hypothetical protein
VIQGVAGNRIAVGRRPIGQLPQENRANRDANKLHRQHDTELSRSICHSAAEANSEDIESVKAGEAHLGAREHIL